MFVTRATAGWTLDELAQNAPLSMWELAPLLDPPFEIEGCYLLTHEQALSRLPGRPPHVPVGDERPRPLGLGQALARRCRSSTARASVIGVIWADDPDDRLVPSRQLMQALRVFANQATAALDSAARFEEVRFLAEHDPLTRLLQPPRVQRSGWRSR